MKNTNEANRQQKDYQDKIELNLAIKKAQDGSDYQSGYSAGYAAGRRAAQIEFMKRMGGK